MPQILPLNVILMLTILIFTILGMITINEMKWKSFEQKKKSYKIKMKPTFFLSLFISFDPKTSIFKEMNWLILMFCLFIAIFSFWKTPSRNKMIFLEIVDKISEQLKIALKTKKDSSEGIVMSLFLIIIFSNILGLFPNIFTSTSHISLNFMIAFPLWMGFLAFGWTNFTNKMLSHLVPNGTPTALISFMVMIEIISNMIRSLTLSVRLMANMVSGHLLLTLMGNLMSESSLLMVIMLTLIQCALSLLELGVAFIQAYVFCMLLTLYSDDSDFN